jgi:hypothetical protein
LPSRQRILIFDGHNDVLLRLHMRGGADEVAAFLDGADKGHLDLLKACKGRICRRLVRDLRTFVYACCRPSRDRDFGDVTETEISLYCSQATLGSSADLSNNACE